jgi:DNA modification methylase
MLLEESEDFRVFHGDVIPHLATMPTHSVDACIYSPPFPSVYSYTSLPEDLGNSEDLNSEARLHFSFFFRQLIRVIKPGRVMVVHCTQIVRMKRSGGQGLFDFRGLLIRLAERAGFSFEYDWVIRKNPQAQAQRVKSWELKFQGLESDRAQSRGVIPDYLLKFVAPGENAVPVDSSGEVSRNNWIDWAECCWSGIREGDTLNVKEGRGAEDTRHICPLQIGVIDRLVRLYSNPGEIIFSPFCGIGSEGYTALKLGRRFYGCELKDEYYHACLKNLNRAIQARRESSRTLFDMIEVGAEAEVEMT